jgi:murein DD-endopeptidase MepM/ murein hydrolase activator NlpD
LGEVNEDMKKKNRLILNKKSAIFILLTFCILTPHPVSANGELTTIEAKSILNIIINKTYTWLSSSSSPWIYPVNGSISSPFGSRASSPNGFHHGIDIAVIENTPVHASKSGIVVRAEFNDMIGNVIEINHSDGTQTMYAHNSKLLVTVGNKVEQGDVISLSGNTGSLSRGSHVHFEIRTNNGTVSINPLECLPSKSK